MKFDNIPTPVARDLIDELDQIIGELIQENQSLRKELESLAVGNRSQEADQRKRLEHVIAQYRQYKQPNVLINGPVNGLSGSANWGTK